MFVFVCLLLFKRRNERPLEVDMVIPIKLESEDEDDCISASQSSNSSLDSYRVVKVDEQRFYEVDFGDGTFSNDMLPEDIIVSQV